jgi:glycosyltransferase involved in cell wall biosynthesis
MRILLINRFHHVDGGADRVYFNTGMLLAKHGHDVAYFSTLSEKNESTPYSYYFIDKIKTRNVSLIDKVRAVRKYLFNKNAIESLQALIIDFKPDLAHIHLFYGTLSVSALTTLKNFKVPVVLTVHDYRLLCPVNSMLDKNSMICEKCKGGKFYNCILKNCSEGSAFQSTIVSVEAYMRKHFFDPLILVDHFIFVSKFSLNKHISYDIRYKTKSTQLYNFNPATIESKRFRGKYFLFFGRLSMEKGILTLLNSIENTDFRVIIAGEGPLRNVVDSYAKKCSNIDYVGFKTQAELVDIILDCSFVILPSEWYENNPMSIVESFNLGKPVIAADIGGIPELVDKDRGFLFESKNSNSLLDAIIVASNISDFDYERMSYNCFNFANNSFNERDHYIELMNIYSELVKNGKEFNK